jgi:lactate dehydrogenase-like 2-hydroxyacid dehydrogenase
MSVPDARVFVTRRLPGDALQSLAASCTLDIWPHPAPPDEAALRQHAATADGLLCLLTDTIDAALMQASPRLRVISNLAVGVDNIDLDAAAQRGIPVGHTPDVLTDATADLTMALILAAARRLPEGIAAVRDGRWAAWSPDWLLGLELRDARLGIIGLGRIGQAVVDRARAFGMEVVHSSRNGGMPLPELLRTADIVSLHCPLSAATRHLIDAGALAAMKAGAILINTARGAIVDQAALAHALRSGQLAAAALDVTDPEPLQPDDQLLRAPNLIVLPHLGSATHRTRERMAELAVENLRAGLAGELLPHRATQPVGPGIRPAPEGDPCPT